MKLAILSATLISVDPIQAWAHEGHGIPGHGNTVAHFVFEPIHLPLALVGCAVAIWFTVHIRARWSRVGR